jgi:DNA-binding beta-propeller fold protein YncE
MVPVNTATNKAGEPVMTIGANARAIAFTPDGRTGYVANGASNTVTPFTTATGKAGKPVKAGGCPIALLVGP